MAVDITRTHHLDKEASRRLVEKIAAALDDKLHFKYAWEGDQLTFRRSGVHGYIAIADHQVRVYVRKSRLLPVSEGWIRQQVEAALDEYLAEE